LGSNGKARHKREGNFEMHSHGNGILGDDYSYGLVTQNYSEVHVSKKIKPFKII